MKNELTILKPEEFGLQKKEAETIETAFLPMIKERDGYIEIYDNLIKKEIDSNTVKEAHELRNKLVKVRTGIAGIHKTQKAFYLAAGKFVDAWKNKETLPGVQMEDGCKKIENHFAEIEEAKREKVRQERNTILEKYETVYDMGDISMMSNDVWKHFLNGVKSDFEEKQAEIKRIEAERIAKEKAEKAEQERIRLENIELKKQAEERERVAKIEADKRAKAEKERLIKEAKEKAVIEEKQRKLFEANEAKLKKEREEKAKIEQELRIARQAEEQRIHLELAAKKEKEKQAAILAKAPIKEKLTKWINETEIVDPLTKEMNKETFELVENIMVKFNSFKKWAKSEIEKS